MNTPSFPDWHAAGIDTRGRTYGNVKTRCPKCDAEKRRGGSDTPLSANVSEGVWLCHRCGYRGRITDKKNERLSGSGITTTSTERPS